MSVEIIFFTCIFFIPNGTDVEISLSGEKVASQSNGGGCGMILNSERGKEL